MTRKTMKNLKEVNLKRWIDLTHFRGTGSKRHNLEEPV